MVSNNWLNRVTSHRSRSPDFVVAFIAQRPYSAINAQSALERQAFEHYLAGYRSWVVAGSTSGR